MITSAAGFIISNFLYFVLENRIFNKIVYIDALKTASYDNFSNEVFKNIDYVLYKDDIRNKKKSIKFLKLKNLI